ncbi:MAG: hypothetical protein RR054_01230 [Clostridia bacterium]
MKQSLPSEILNTLFVGLIGKSLCSKLKLKVDKTGFMKLKPPYLLLINHCSTEDFEVAMTVMYPQPLNFVASGNRFIRRKFLMDLMGVIKKRQFNIEVDTVNNIFEVIKMNGVVALYPEEKYSVDGTEGIIRPSIGKLIKYLNVPVAMLQLSGLYLDKPRYSNIRRGAIASAKLINLLSLQQVKLYSADEIYTVVFDAFKYDEYEYQRENRIMLKNKNSAVGLHTILYKCPLCQKEFVISSDKDTLKCSACGAQWSIGRYGIIVGNNNTTPFDSVPAWNFYQKKSVKRQLQEGTYTLEGKCKLMTLPDNKGYKLSGKGNFSHDKDAFIYNGTMDGKTVMLTFNNSEMYTLSFKGGESVEFSSHSTVYRFELEDGLMAAKLSLAVEEAYKLLNPKLTETEEEAKQSGM